MRRWRSCSAARGRHQRSRFRHTGRSIALHPADAHLTGFTPELEVAPCRDVAVRGATHAPRVVAARRRTPSHPASGAHGRTASLLPGGDSNALRQQRDLPEVKVAVAREAFAQPWWPWREGRAGRRGKGRFPRRRRCGRGRGGRQCSGRCPWRRCGRSWPRRLRMQPSQSAGSELRARG